MNPSLEQTAVRDSNARKLKVNAFAGTGKTSTCVLYTSQRPDERIMYLAFNKANQREAEARFPRNVVCKTTHAIAYAAIGRTYSHKLCHGNLRATDVLGVLNVKLGYAKKFAYAKSVLDALNCYLASGHKEICQDHAAPVPNDFGYTQSDVAHGANLLWGLMRDKNRSDVPLLHDGYLKMWQLSEPELRGYDTIVLDEAQDTNLPTIMVMENQRCGRLYIGDTHQSIYGFRGSVDALNKLSADESLNLTQSFRFGNNIAHVANKLLHRYKGEKVMVHGLGGQDVIGRVDRTKKHGIVCRTNAFVFDEAAMASEEGKRLHFVGGINGYNFNRIEDAYNLFMRSVDLVRDNFLRAVGSFAALQEFAEMTDDKELKQLCKIVLKYGRSIPAILDRIRKASEERPIANPVSGWMEDRFDADVFLMTAHKSKGMEFRQVLMSDDYVKLFDGGKPLPVDEVEAEEVNILYVAATRASKLLQPCNDISLLLAA